MKFTPNYGVWYRDGFHEAGKPFEIEAEDAEEMKQHGIVEEPELDAEAPESEPSPRPKKTRKKAE